jgi:F-type H+-transporting ATPase subunit epsilon
MRLSVISLKGIEFNGEASSLNVKTTSGEITVLSGHRPLITELSPCTATIIKSDGQKITFEVHSGFLEIGEKSIVSLLLN